MSLKKDMDIDRKGKRKIEKCQYLENGGENGNSSYYAFQFYFSTYYVTNYCECLVL